MKTTHLRSFIAVTILCAGSVALAIEKELPVAVNVEGLPTHVADQVRAHAAEGLTSLRGYLERTRFIHQIRIEDVIKKQNPARMARQEKPEPAERETVVAKSKAE